MVKYRQAEEKDYKKINDFHNRLYSSNRTIEQFRWEFHNSPAGRSIYIIGEDNDEIAGTNCVIPIFLINSKGEKVLTGKSEDTLVDPKYRGQNVFYNLYQVLFEKCIENGVKVIWGFTSAYKPFKKLGFKIPYEHQQILIANRIVPSFKYLSSLNRNNRLIDKAKILGLCFFSKLNYSFKSTNNLVLKRFHISTEAKIDQVNDLIQANLKEKENAFAIDQSSEFQQWRIYDNSNSYKIHTFSFENDNNKLVVLLIFNSQPNMVAYISQSTFHPELSQKESVEMVKYATKEIFREGITLIRNWVFDHNSYNKQEIDFFKKAKYKIIMQLDDDVLMEKNCLYNTTLRAARSPNTK